MQTSTAKQAVKNFVQRIAMSLELCLYQYLHQCYDTIHNQENNLSFGMQRRLKMSYSAFIIPTFNVNAECVFQAEEGSHCQCIVSYLQGQCYPKKIKVGVKHVV